MDTLIAFLIALLIAVVVIPVALAAGVIIAGAFVLFEIVQIVYKIVTRNAEAPDQR